MFVMEIVDEVEGNFKNRDRTHNDCGPQLVGEFLQQFDELQEKNRKDPYKEVLVVAATNLVDFVDPAVWRRLGSQFHVGLPTDSDRMTLIKTLLGEGFWEKLSQDNISLLEENTKG